MHVSKPIHKVILKIITERSTGDLQGKAQSDICITGRFLDLGCGSGNSVQALLDIGIDVFGYDTVFRSGNHIASLVNEGRVKLIEQKEESAYNIPFPDSFFDLVYADQVVEHVQDIGVFTEELFRVLKTGGLFVAYLPSKFKPFEAHVGIPLGGVFSSLLYIKICVLVGMYKSKKRQKYRKLSSLEIAETIKEWLDEKTYYRTKSELYKVFSKKFQKVECREDLLLDSISGNTAGIIRRIPFGVKLFGAVWSHLIIAEKQG